MPSDDKQSDSQKSSTRVTFRILPRSALGSPPNTKPDSPPSCPTGGRPIEGDSSKISKGSSLFDPFRAFPTRLILLLRIPRNLVRNLHVLHLQAYLTKLTELMVDRTQQAVGEGLELLENHIDKYESIDAVSIVSLRLFRRCCSAVYQRPLYNQPQRVKWDD